MIDIETMGNMSHSAIVSVGAVRFDLETGKTGATFYMNVDLQSYLDAGMDLTATSRHFDAEGNVVYGTGLAFEIPEGHVGLIFPRSSNAKKDLILTNSVGVEIFCVIWLFKKIF